MRMKLEQMIKMQMTDDYKNMRNKTVHVTVIQNG